MCGVQTQLLFSPSLYRRSLEEIEINVLPAKPFSQPSPESYPHPPSSSSSSQHPPPPHSVSAPASRGTGVRSGAATAQEPLHPSRAPSPAGKLEDRVSDITKRFYRRRQRNSLNVWLGFSPFSLFCSGKYHLLIYFFCGENATRCSREGKKWWEAQEWPSTASLSPSWDPLPHNVLICFMIYWTLVPGFF